jgi:sugar phosphate isomerase/epimerase
MKVGICSFSFHRAIGRGGLDVFSYIDTCAKLGCTQIDPWSAHLCPPEDAAAVLKAGKNPNQSHQLLSGVDSAFLDRIAAYAERVGLPFGTFAVDGAHIYEESRETFESNRRRAVQWIDAAGRLGAAQIRIDAGGPPVLTDEILKVIINGYHDLLAQAKRVGVELMIENHWGPSTNPEQLLRILDACPGLGLLFDTRNFPADRRETARKMLAPRARATHLKSKRFDATGDDAEDPMATCINMLLDAGYAGVWGIESVPEDGDELAAASNTIELLRRTVDGRK